LEKTVAVIGAGNIGRFVIHMITRKISSLRLLVVDLDKSKIKKIKEMLNASNVEFIVGDLISDNDVRKKICDSDIILSFLPGNIGSKIYSLAIECGMNLIDTSYTPEDPFVFDQPAKDAGVTIIPDAGVAPGLSNLVAGHIYSELGSCDVLAIYVGGLPKNPKPPLYHMVNWSITDLIEEYTRPVRIIVDSKLKIVEPLTGIEKIEIGNLGVFEAFYTDGLRTMVKTIKAKNMYEKTLRYEGHLSAIRLLKEIGLFSRDEITVGGHRIKPIDLAVELLKKQMYDPNLEDKLVMKVVGGKEGRSIEYIIYDEYKTTTGFSAMSRTTGLASFSMLKLLLENKIDNGVIPLEIIGQNKVIFDEVIGIYRVSNVKIWENLI